MVLLYDCNENKIELEAVYLCALSVSLILWLSMMGIIKKNWNWTRPQALVQNQLSGELISARNRGCTSIGVYVPCIYTHARWVTVGHSGLCCCTCLTYFKRLLTPLFVDLNKKQKNSLNIMTVTICYEFGKDIYCESIILLLFDSGFLCCSDLTCPGSLPTPHPPPEFLSLLLLFFPLFC